MNQPHSHNTTYSKIYAEYYEPLYRYGSQTHGDTQLVEDCIHDLFLRICEDPKMLHHVEVPFAYLKTCLRNALSQHSKVIKKTVELSPKLIHLAVPAYEEQLIAKQDNIQLGIKMQNLISSLSTSQRNILTLRFYQNKSYDAIAEELHITKQTIYNQIHSAIKQLRSFF